MNKSRVVGGTLLAVAVIGANATSAPAHPASGTKAALNYLHFLDPTGDNGTAPDVTRETVTNYGNGTIGFDTEFASGFPGQRMVKVYINSDNNASTGSPNTSGADYLIEDYEGDHTFDFSRWNGSSWDDSIPHSTIRFTNTATSVEIRVNKTELHGSANMFDFWVASAENRDATALSQFDLAPNDGTWAFSFQPLTLKFRFFTLRANKGSLTASATAIRSDDQKPISAGQYTIFACRATVGGAPLRVTARGQIYGRRSPYWGCVWAVPASLVGKMAHGSISIGWQLTTTSQSFTARLK
jgi:hypothetical protein